MYIYICLYISIYICLNIHIHIHVCIIFFTWCDGLRISSTFALTDLSAVRETYIYLYIYLSICLYLSIYPDSHTHTCIYVYIHSFFFCTWCDGLRISSTLDLTVLSAVRETVRTSMVALDASIASLLTAPFSRSLSPLTQEKDGLKVPCIPK